MQKRVRRSARRAVITAAFGLACLPGICQAQETGPLFASAKDMAAAATPTDVAPSSIKPADSKSAQGLGGMLPLYVSFATLQALDAHSTLRAVQNGATEQNPLMSNFADKPAALIAVKAGVTASAILLTESLRSKHRVGAFALMTALNSAYAMVVVHNYRTIP